MATPVPGQSNTTWCRERIALEGESAGLLLGLAEHQDFLEFAGGLLLVFPMPILADAALGIDDVLEPRPA